MKRIRQFHPDRGIEGMRKRHLPFGPILAAAVIALSALPSTLIAMDGAELARRVYDREDGDDAYAHVRMLLIDKSGHKRMRTMISARKDYGELSKSLIRFTSPESIKGTGFLTWENEEGDDDQFLYLPALRRVRRIVSRQKDGQFVNTDYTYEDMQRRKPERDEHKILGTETVEGYDCRVLESVPKDPKSTQYSKVVNWVIKDMYLPVKTEYYEKRGRLEKVFMAREIKEIQGIQSVLESELRSFRRKHRTLMKTEDIKYNTGIPDRVFTRRYLENPD
ncbi:MAG: outer membrane lipoprotein-sorting protein [Desulfobacteraceae bacterium]